MARRSYAQARRTRRRKSPREGQSLIEVAVGMIVFLVAMLAVIDASLVLYHQLAISQATKKTARRAGTNLYDRTDIDRTFWISLPPSLISSTSNASVTVTTAATDVNFASTEAPAGQPAVTINATYNHSLIGGFGWIPSFTLRARAVAQITTWTPDYASVQF